MSEVDRKQVENGLGPVGQQTAHRSKSPFIRRSPSPPRCGGRRARAVRSMLCPPSLISEISKTGLTRFTLAYVYFNPLRILAEKRRRRLEGKDVFVSLYQLLLANYCVRDGRNLASKQALPWYRTKAMKSK